MKPQNEILFIRENLAREFGLAAAGDDFRNLLAERINQLIDRDFSTLVTTLYRLDVYENKLRQALFENPDKNAGELIADLVIKRLLEKCKSRTMYPPNADIPDDEKW